MKIDASAAAASTASSSSAYSSASSSPSGSPPRQAVSKVGLVIVQWLKLRCCLSADKAETCMFDDDRGEMGSGVKESVGLHSSDRKDPPRQALSKVDLALDRGMKFITFIEMG